MRCNLCGLEMEGTAYCLARVGVEKRAYILDCCGLCLEDLVGLPGLRRLVAAMSRGGFTVQYLPGMEPA